MKTLTKPQTTVMETLYDVATHEGGGIILKNRYHSPAHALILKGYVRKQDRFPYRPHYFITDEGRAYWASLLTPLAVDVCPVCIGLGRVYQDKVIVGDVCSACNGTGHATKA